MKLQDYNPDFNNIITISRVLDKRGTKQTSLLLDTTNNKFFVVDDDDNAYLLNPDFNEPEYIQTIIDLLNSIISEIDSCPDCLIYRLDEIKTIISNINNEDVISLINSSIIDVISSINQSNIEILNELEIIKNKVKNETIIYRDVVKEIIKWKTKIEKEVQYVEVRTTVYVQSKDKKPNKVETLPPTTTPPQSIGGWNWDPTIKWYVKWKRGKKYIMNDYQYKLLNLGSGQVSYSN